MLNELVNDMDTVYLIVNATVVSDNDFHCSDEGNQVFNSAQLPFASKLKHLEDIFAE